jgi:REP element-mobilizing transposase RayT
MYVALQKRADMESAPTRYRRRSIRLKHYDYSSAGYYFVTIVAQGRAHLFGEIVDGQMVLNMAGEMVGRWYEKLEEKFPCIQNHDMVIMPNHIHFIIEMMDSVGADPRVRPQSSNHEKFSTNVCRYGGEGAHTGAPLRNESLGTIIQWFKTMTTNAYIQMVKNGSCPPFHKRIWQRNYYEHVIRNEHDYARLADYIVHNPVRWEEDRFAKN